MQTVRKLSKNLETGTKIHRSKAEPALHNLLQISYASSIVLGQDPAPGQAFQLYDRGQVARLLFLKQWAVTGVTDSWVLGRVTSVNAGDVQTAPGPHGAWPSRALYRHPRARKACRPRRASFRSLPCRLHPPLYTVGSSLRTYWLRSLTLTF